MKRKVFSIIQLLVAIGSLMLAADKVIAVFIGKVES
jgi:hypothetical protein